MANSRDSRQPCQKVWIRDQPAQPSIVTNNHETIDLDVEANRGERPPQKCVLPLARYCAVGALNGRQREIRIGSRWWVNVCAANAYLVNDSIGGRCWAHSKKHSSD